MATFGILKAAAATILDFQSFEILTAANAEGAKLRHRANFVATSFYR